MAIMIKNKEQIRHMRIACEIVAKTHEVLEKEIRPGITTKELDIIAADYIKSWGATPSFLGYPGHMGADNYPASICTSVNEEVIHGIPGLRKLKDGDIISIDIGAYINGFHGDGARTFLVGNVDERYQNLVSVTRQSFFEGIRYARSGNHLHEISGAIGDYAESYGYAVVREFVGHGVGKNLHEDPQIPHFRVRSRGPKLCPGMILAIEPMINEGTFEVKVLEDGWTVVTKDGKRSAHYENTVLITDGEPELLTLI